MYLSDKVNKQVSKIRKEIISRKEFSYTEFKILVDKHIRCFGAKCFLDLKNKKKNEISIGGEFDTSGKKTSILVNICLSSKIDKIKIDKKRLDGLLFLLYQVLVHELIHKHQFENRFEDCSSYYIELDDKKEMNEEQMYLADYDEIDAYASDCSLEIIRHYPDEYMTAFDEIGKRDIDSYEYYKQVFSGTLWGDIKKRLLKKIYLWLVSNVNNGWIYTTN